LASLRLIVTNAIRCDVQRAHAGEGFLEVRHATPGCPHRSEPPQRVVALDALRQILKHHPLFLRPNEPPAGDLAVPLLQELRRVVLVHRMRALSVLLSVTVVRDPEGLAALEDSAHAGHGLPSAWCSCRVAHCSSFL